MTGPSFFDVVLGQRACRAFTDEDVPDDDLVRMLEAAAHAPSAENAQPGCSSSFATRRRGRPSAA